MTPATVHLPLNSPLSSPAAYKKARKLHPDSYLLSYSKGCHRMMQNRICWLSPVIVKLRARGSMAGYVMKDKVPKCLSRRPMSRPSGSWGAEAGKISCKDGRHNLLCFPLTSRRLNKTILEIYVVCGGSVSRPAKTTRDIGALILVE